MIAAVLGALGVLAAMAAAWEVIGALERPGRPAVGRAGQRSLGLLGLERPLAGSGLQGRLRPWLLVAAHPVGAMLGAVAAQIAAPAAPARTGIALFVLLPVGGFVAPRVLLEAAARRRLERVEAALPDALELLAASAAAGRAPHRMAVELPVGEIDPLGAELGMLAAEAQAGAPLAKALERLRQRVPTPAIAAMVTVLNRAARLGTPISEQLAEQAASLRAARARAAAEHASRAAPKIQLVVALVLVPSVLLMIGAALAANADSLLAGL